MWQEGQSKVFLKDAALRLLGNWKLGHKVTVILARYRMWITRKKYRRSLYLIKKMKRKAVGWLYRRRYAKQIKEAVKLQALFRGCIFRTRLRQRKYAIIIQTIIRAFTSRLFVRHRRAGLKVLTRLRRLRFVTRRKAFAKQVRRAKMTVFNIIICAYHRRKFLQVRRIFVFLQVRWTWKVCYRFRLEQKYKFEKKVGALLISKNLRRFVLSKRIDEWVQEMIAAITWGDVEEMKSLFACESAEFKILKAVPQKEHLRDRFAHFKSFIHAAVACEPINLGVIRLLISQNCTLDCRNAHGSTPLHICAENGDESFEATRTILDGFLKTMEPSKSEARQRAFVLAQDNQHSTAIDVARMRKARKIEELLLKIGGEDGEQPPGDEPEFATDYKSRRLSQALKAAIHGPHRLSQAEKHRMVERTRISDAHIKFFMISTKEPGGSPSNGGPASPSTKTARRRHEEYQARVKASKQQINFMRFEEKKQANQSFIEDAYADTIKDVTPEHVLDKVVAEEEKHEGNTNIDEGFPEIMEEDKDAEEEKNEGDTMADRGFPVIMEEDKDEDYLGDANEPAGNSKSAAVHEAEQKSGAEEIRSEANTSLQNSLSDSSGMHAFGGQASNQSVERTLSAKSLSALLYGSPALQPSPASSSVMAPIEGGKKKNRYDETGVDPAYIQECKANALSLRRIVAYSWNRRTEEERQGWYYKDEKGEVQGPFSNQLMNKWYRAGRFKSDTHICMGEPQTMWFKVSDMFTHVHSAFQIKPEDMEKAMKVTSLYLHQRLWGNSISAEEKKRLAKAP